MKATITICLFFVCFLLLTCSKDKAPEPYIPPAGTTVIPATNQRGGDPVAGYDYLVNGGYLSAGIPYSIYLLGVGEDNTNVLDRTGDNAVIRYDNTAFDAPNGVRVVAPNCFACHSSTLNGEFVMGLGNTRYDGTIDHSEIMTLAASAVTFAYGVDSPEWEAFEPHQKSNAATAPYTITAARGPNPGDYIAQILAHHRDPNTLEWDDTPLAPIPNTFYPTDVPPWWVLKKKNAVFYTATGRGDFSRCLMTASMLNLPDTARVNEVDRLSPDIIAYINSVEPPVYPQGTDEELVTTGKVIFEENCASCHGTYGEEETYPNLLVALDVVRTDPFLSNNFASSNYAYFTDWFNNGWFGKAPNPAQFISEGGYVAQPLDGIWASAPYLHNGSIPTLEDLLHSSQRPTYWKRSFDDSDFDYEKVGWNYTIEPSKTDNETYDTTLDGYGNGGHTYGDVLNSNERKALIEYLKTI